MAKPAELILTFKKDGSVHKEVNGVVGKNCESLTAFVEKFLGGRDIQRTRKEVYHVNTDKNRKPLLNSDIRNAG
jgi:hypothetical protein